MNYVLSEDNKRTSWLRLASVLVREISEGLPWWIRHQSKSLTESQINHTERTLRHKRLDQKYYTGSEKIWRLDGLQFFGLQICWKRYLLSSEPTAYKQNCDLLQQFFRGSLVRHFAQPWRSVKVIFIPKAVKRSLKLPKDFKPVVLTCSVLKTGIESDELLRHPIEKSQLHNMEVEPLTLFCTCKDYALQPLITS